MINLVPIGPAYTANGSDQVSWSNIPQNFAHLQIHVNNRGQRASQNTDVSYIRFNGDFGVNYNSHYVSTNNTTIAADWNNVNGFMYLGPYSIPDNNYPNAWSSQIWEILDYSNTSKFKTIKVTYGWNTGSYGSVGIMSGTWRSTAAIDNIPGMGNASLVPLAGSSYSLYGVPASNVTGA